MKKTIALLLAAVLCMSLCACGGLAGEKAALLYPDIIGKWGNDPFGEESVLILSEDGSCSVLGDEGTWTLDKKGSDEEKVQLSVKTEKMKYFVELDRVREDRRYMYGAVELLIMDAKKQIEIYRGSVYQPGEEFVYSELALQAVPELVGEWGSPYWYEEPMLTIREDGSCTVLRQPGKWCLSRDFSTWPKVLILVKMENGRLYEIEFGLDTGVDWGYLKAHMDIYDREQNMSVWTDPDTGSSVVRVVNREALIHPLEHVSVAVGQWFESADMRPVATFNEDGSCTIRGAEGVWTLDYTAYYNEKYLNGWDYFLRAKIRGDEYDIYFSANGNGSYCMYILDQSDGIYILEVSDVVKTDVQ